MAYKFNKQRVLGLAQEYGGNELGLEDLRMIVALAWVATVSGRIPLDVYAHVDEHGEKHEFVVDWQAVERKLKDQTYDPNKEQEDVSGDHDAATRPDAVTAAEDDGVEGCEDPVEAVG